MRPCFVLSLHLLIIVRFDSKSKNRMKKKITWIIIISSRAFFFRQQEPPFIVKTELDCLIV